MFCPDVAHHSINYAPIFGSNSTGQSGQGTSTTTNVIFGIGVCFK